MKDSLKQAYVDKARDFRIKHGLSEEDIDSLLQHLCIGYSRLESGKRTLTLELAEAYPLIYGLEYCDFKKETTLVPEFGDLPQSTQDFINNKSGSGGKVGAKGTKNKASHVIMLIKDFAVGHKFCNIDIIPQLPSPLNQESTIDWNKGLLKGLVKNTSKSKIYEDENGEKKRQTIYEIIKAVDALTIKKAQETIEKELLG